MLCFEDIVLARLIARRLPEQRPALLAQLDALQRHERSSGLLATLVSRQALTWEQAQQAQAHVESHKRQLRLESYRKVLEHAQVPAPEIARLQAGAPDVDQLGAALVSAGLLAVEREEQLRFRARVAYDRAMSRVVDGYLSRRGATPGGPGGPGRLTRSLARAQLNLPDSLPRSSDELPIPHFRVPGWIDTSDTHIGQTLGGYRVLGRIGAGAMGIVFLADHPDQPERPVALKVLRDDSSEDARGRFKREILAGSFISDPGVVDVYDAGSTESGAPYLAMEFVDGADLTTVLETEGRLGPGRALEVARQTFSALAGAHRANVVHRDIKPANILITCGDERARLMDFGLAILLDMGQFNDQLFHTREGLLSGTPMYMSPEQASGEPLITPAADIYSLGIVLYELLTGRLPFDAQTTSGYLSAHMYLPPKPLGEACPEAKQLPQRLHELVTRLLTKSPSARPQSAEDVARELGEIAAQVATPEDARSIFALQGKRRG